MERPLRDEPPPTDVRQTAAVPQVDREWVSLTSRSGARAGHGSNPGQGLYWRPSGKRPTVAFVATHYNVDFAEHYLAAPLAERGFGFLGWNTRFRGNDTYFRYDGALDDIEAGVRWLRESAGAETLVLLGNSGGGSLMAAYQAERAELAGDLYVALNAHPGRPEVLTGWLDPSVTDEGDPTSTDPDLDMYDQRHEPPYGADFAARYRQAQRARNERITTWARAELTRLQEQGTYDRVFGVPRSWADLRFLDLTLDASTRTMGCYAGDPRVVNRSPFGLAATASLRTWLAMWSLDGSRAQRDLAALDVPALVVQSTGDRGVYPSDARALHDAIGSRDKTLIWLPGEHYFEDTGPAAAADHVAEWARERLSAGA